MTVPINTTPVTQTSTNGAKQASMPDSNLADASNLTQSQLMIWLGQKLNPDAPLYNMVHTFTIHGSINPTSFQAAFQALLDRSDALRTVIDEINNVPQQRVVDDFRYTVEYLDFSTEPDPDQTLRDWVDNRRQRLLNLADCLFDTILIKLTPDKSVWYLNMHHLITDVTAFALVYRRMAEFYALAEAGRLTDAPELPTYADFVAQERAARQSEQAAVAEDFWREKLTDPIEATNFYGRTLVEARPRTRRVPLDLGQRRSEQLKTIAQEKGIRSLTLDLSLFHIFAATLATLLYRISGKKRLAIGTPFHNRTTVEAKETIGLFINVYPMLVEIAEDDTFLSLIKKGMREMMTTLRHAQHSLNPDHSKVYDVVLNYIKASFNDFGDLSADNAWIHPGYGDNHHAVRLQVHDFEDTGSLVLYFDFNSDIFDDTRQQWFRDHFLHLLDSLIEDRQQPVSRIDLLAPAEHKQLVEAFNQTAAPFPQAQTVVELFEAQAAQTPDAVAVTEGQRTLTYADLDQQSNVLARHLIAEGVRPDDLVAIHMTRSLDFIIAVWGVLKAGGAYVPIDSAYPAERIAYILNDIRGEADRPPLLLTQQPLAANLPKNVARPIIWEQDWPLIAAAHPAEALPPQSAPTNLAYVIYTSGSTGRPKGVMIEQRGLVNYVCWAQKQYLQGEVLDFPLFSSISFDLTVTSVFVPLLSGGRVVVYGEADNVRGMEVLRIVEEQQVDVVKLTPSHLSLVKDRDLSGSRIKRLIVGGEDFKTSLARTIHEAFRGNIEIYNEYGPTEAVVGCMIHRYNPERDIEKSVPIGTPADNAQIYLLDDNQQPVSPGVIGEMVIGGAGVARGYLSRSELSAERFVTTTFRPDQRLYRTGDLARWTRDGQLQFLGRADHQVKVRGARIELGEIEAALLNHPHISEAVVEVIQYEQPTEPQTLAFCVKCGLPSTYPGSSFDTDGVCQICRFYDRNQHKIEQYFKTEADLQSIIEAAKASKRGKYDCMVLLSGGKDSTYVLAQLVEMGLTPLVFTLDNGYISQGALGNIRRVVERLGLDWLVETTPAMDEIFTDSLKRYSNVCQGCFKTIYTLSMNQARKHGIRYIFTGLSRGQLFETRLGHLFQGQEFDVEDMDGAILEARKLYHRLDDAVSRLLDVEIFKNDMIFEEIQFVDYYRYRNVALDEMLAFLKHRVDWVRPTDTGRSTNCLINEAGIYVHHQERGYHNYALPYSWDVRLGHKTREAAMAELDDDIHVPTVKRMLREVGYDLDETALDKTEARLAAYFVADRPLTVTDLRSYLTDALPDYMIPTYFIQLEEMPLTQNGKIDRQALPGPEEGRPELSTRFVAPNTPIEAKLAGIWSQTLNVKRVGIQDNFFDLGGASVPAVQVLTRVAQAFGVELPLSSLFEAPTVAELSEQVEETLLAEIEALSDEEAEQLLID